MTKHARLLIVAAVPAALAVFLALHLPSMRAQTMKIVWMDALCGANPVNRNLHDRLNTLAGARRWESQAATTGCEWATDDLRADALDRELTRNADAIGSVIRANPRDTTLVILANSMVAARLGDLRPGVINARLVTRELYLFSTDPDVLCRQTSRLRVGYVRGTARRAEIVNTLAHENPRRVVSAIDATDFTAPGDMTNLLGPNGSLEIAALVADDLGGSYDTFKQQVLDPRGDAIKSVARCTAAGDQGPPRLEKSLDGSVSYLTIAAPPAAPAPAPLVALLRPGQEPGVAPQKTWFVRWTESLFPTVQTADSEVRASDFKDFPVVLAVGASASELAADRDLKQALSHSYFEGMFDSLTAGLNPCKERSDTLFGLYLLNSYLDDRSSVEKGCALEAYYELVSTTPRRPATAQKNRDILKTDPGLSACLSRNPPPAPLSATGPAAAVACEPTEKEFLEARDYGQHYAYYRLGLKVIAASRNQSGPAREQSLRRAETCLRRALQLQPERTCSKFSQGLFVVPYEPSLPLGAARLKGGK